MQQFRDVVWAPTGRPITSATITVTTEAGAPAVLYSDNEGTLLPSNVLDADETGEYQFYAANGRYTCSIVAAGYATETREALLFDPEDARFRETVSVKDFGAVGDGVADDTAAVQAALETGLSVYFPAGTYAVSELSGLTNIQCTGDGAPSRLLWKAGAPAVNWFSLTGQCMARFVGLVFDSNRQNQSDTTGYYGAFGGTLADGARVVFENCQFVNGRITDLYLSGPTTAGQSAVVELHQCRFYDGLVGDSSRAAQSMSISEGIRLRVSNCSFEQPTSPASYGRGGIVMQRPADSTSTAWGRLVVSGSDFTNCGRGTLSALGAVYVYSGSELTTIVGNTFRDSSGTAITVKADCGNTTVTGNTVYGMVNAPSYAALCFFGQADTLASSLGRNLVVSGNTVRNPQYQSIFVDGSREGLPNFENVVIANNLCDAGVRGITLRNIKTVAVTGNTVTNTTGIGIFVDGAVEGDVAFTNNIVSAGLVGIRVGVASPAARVRVAGNTVTGLTGPAIDISQAVESFDISNNYIQGCTNAFTVAGATQSSFITGNTVRNETGVLSKVGSYTTLTWRDNITSGAMGFTGARSQTISAGVITAFADWHYVATEAGAATDDLVTINGGYEGRELTLCAASNTEDVVLKDGTGNLVLAGDCTLDHSTDTIRLMYRSSAWYEVSRSNNA